MKQPYWIWYPDDFEVYHHQLLQNRRTDKGIYYGQCWAVSSPHRNVFFKKIATVEKEETVVLHTNAPYACFTVLGVRYFPEQKVVVPPGTHALEINLFKEDGFPCAYVEGDIFASDESWLCRTHAGSYQPAGWNEMFRNPEDDPEVFPFRYEKLLPVTKEKQNGGTLYDFGKETFAKPVFENLKENVSFTVYCGESRQEALSKEHSEVRLFLKADGNECVGAASAFRYLFIEDGIGDYTLHALYEVLPIPKVGSFCCSDTLLNQIWNTSAYTFELNSREAFIDGIKRDRWVWSGDAYQSYLTSAYLYDDSDIIRRTMVMLRGNEPFCEHINTIVDYTFYWLASIREYCQKTMDLAFLKRMYGKMEATVRFLKERLDEDGLYQRKPEDWVFIDWASFDKDAGPICAEQMLLWYALVSMAECAELLQKDSRPYREMAQKVCRGIEKYWDKDLGAYVDDWKTGNRNVTRHANIFALRFGLTDEKRKQSILQNVLLNDEVPQITTPYFRFFELEALAEYGRKKEMLEAIRSYWGGMLQQGATSIWEAYNPKESGDEHLCMYGRPFGRSLCHAWGASPIYLLGKYILGVRFSSNANRFTVCPETKLLDEYCGTVPVNGGKVKIQLKNRALKIESDISGGTLCVNGRSLPLMPKQELIVSLD